MEYCPYRSTVTAEGTGEEHGSRREGPEDERTQAVFLRERKHKGGTVPPE